MTKYHSGGCLCGAVTFKVTGDLAAPNVCHCDQCRKQSGHYWASTDLNEADVEIEGADALTWFQSSAKVRRGFCSQCGSFLFWHPTVNDTIAIAMGAFDQPTDVNLSLHIFTSQKGDYYEISDGLPQNER